MALDITIRAGTNRPVKFDFSTNAPADFTTAGKTFELVVQWNGGRMIYTSDSALDSHPDKAGPAPAIIDAKSVLWSFSLADTRAFPLGREARIELQWSVGGIQDSDAGMLTVTPGISND
jgi:hypothetical protein